MKKEEILERDEELEGLLDYGYYEEESFEEAKARFEEENKSFAQLERFVMDNVGTYTVRFAPILPKEKGTKPDRFGYEYPVRSIFLKVDVTDKDGNVKTKSFPVTRPTDCGYSVDPISVYRNLAKAKSTEIAELIGKTTFEGGLRYNFSHASIVFDADSNKPQPMLLELSHAQFKALEEEKMSVWEKLCKKDPNTRCPVSSFSQGYNVEITKSKSGKKVEYKVGIDTVSGENPLSKEDLEKVFKAPRIPELVYRFTRWNLGAMKAGLKKYDEEKKIGLFDHPELQAAFDKLEKELPADDTSSFNGAETDPATNSALTYDSLMDMFDDWDYNDGDEKSDAGVELKGKIREFIEQEELDIKVTRKSTIENLINQIEAIFEEGEGTAEETDKGEVEEEKKESKVIDEEEELDNDDVEDEEEDDEEEEEEHNLDTNEPALRPRLRRRRK